MMRLVGEPTGKSWVKLAMRADQGAIRRMMDRPPKAAEVDAIVALLKSRYLPRSPDGEVQQAYAAGWFA